MSTHMLFGTHKRIPKHQKDYQDKAWRLNNMNIVNFTPQSAFLGGIIIGLAVIIFFIGNGRLAGISGIVNDTLVSKQNRTDNFFFIFGLVLGPIFYTFLTKINIPFLIKPSLPIIISAGLLVGIGTKIGSGCTSGHGICGISRLSLRSITATIIFMITAIITVKLIG